MPAPSRKPAAPARTVGTIPFLRNAQPALPPCAAPTSCPCSARPFRLRTSAIRLRQAPAGHILVAAVRMALAHHLLLAATQLLAVRWVRSSGWDCYLPAALLNAWHLALAGALPNAERGARAQRAPLVGNAES